MLGLAGAGGRDADIARLRVAEGGQLDAELVEVQRGDLLVEVFGQDVDLFSYLPWLVKSSA